MPPSAVRPPSLVGYPSYLAAQVAKSASRLLGEELAPYGVRTHHFAVLAALQDLGPQCQQDLCDRLDLDKSHMVGFVDDLEGMGHVVRTRDVEDRRRHRVQLTPSGRGLLVQLFAVEARCQDALFGMLQPADRQHLVALLRTVVDTADGNRLGPRQVPACEPAPGPAGAPAASPAVTAAGPAVTPAGPAVTPAEVGA